MRVSILDECHLCGNLYLYAVQYLDVIGLYCFDCRHMVGYVKIEDFKESKYIKLWR